MGRIFCSPLLKCSENGLFTPRAFFLKLGWSPGFEKTQHTWNRRFSEWSITCVFRCVAFSGVFWRLPNTTLVHPCVWHTETPPICITVSQYFGRSMGVRGRWHTPRLGSKTDLHRKWTRCARSWRLQIDATTVWAKIMTGTLNLFWNKLAEALRLHLHTWIVSELIQECIAIILLNCFGGNYGKEKDDDHDQESLKTDLRHIWSWSSEKCYQRGEGRWPWPRFPQESLAMHMVMVLWKIFLKLGVESVSGVWARFLRLGKRNHTPPCSSPELFFAEKNGVHRTKILVVDVFFPGFYRVFVSTTGLESFSLRPEKLSKRFSCGGGCVRFFLLCRRVNSVHTRGVVKKRGFTRGVCKNPGFY